MNVVLCLLLAGVGQVEEGLCEGLCDGLCTDMELGSPSVFNFLNAPSIVKIYLYFDQGYSVICSLCQPHSGDRIEQLLL